MAKTSKKTAPAAKAAKAKKPAAANKIEISFGAWVNNIARARGGLADIVTNIRDDKSITDKTTIATAQKKYDGELFPMLAARYNAFLKRGSQSKAA